MTRVLSKFFQKVSTYFKMPENLTTQRKRLREFEENPEGFKVAKTDHPRNSEKLRKCAILMMYSGCNYRGMQRNDGFPTIEGELLSSLLKAGLITEEQAAQPSRIQFQRASKTDKHVSAAGQVCAAKLPFGNGIPIETINQYLPEQIRILDVFRVTQRFCPKGACDHRVYQYLLPTFAFAPRGTLTQANCWRYRLPAETFTLTNKIFLRYKGTHNYFNFTSRRDASDKSCSRYILSIECGEPFLLDGDKQFTLVTVIGQSFMLHQIRKMIGLVIAIVSGYTTEVIFDTAFKTARIDIPKAPGLGLLLDKVIYVRYNNKFCSDGSHHEINWMKYKEHIDAFKETHIFRYILKKEIEENSMLEWVNSIDKHTFDCRPDGPPLFITMSTNGKEEKLSSIVRSSALASDYLQVEEPVIVETSGATSLPINKVLDKLKTDIPVESNASLRAAETTPHN